MGRKKTAAALAADTPPAPISLLRVEDRVERVPITPEQVHERMIAAAAAVTEANMIDAEVVELRERVKLRRAAAVAKHEEADRIVLDARSGTVASTYPVIVERHSTRPATMLVWRAPDGVLAADILTLALDPDADHIEAREAQGCILVEERAMTPDELRAAEDEDAVRAQPQLPFPEQSAPPEPAEPAAEVGDGQGAAVGIAQETGATGEGVDAAQAETTSDDEDQDGATDDVAEAARTTPSKPRCPFILVEGGTPIDDQICGKEGTPRARGFCPEHKAVKGAIAVRAAMRRKERQRLQAAVQEASDGDGDGGAVDDTGDTGDNFEPDAATA